MPRSPKPAQPRYATQQAGGPVSTGSTCYLMQLDVVAILAQIFQAGVAVFGDHVSTVANASSFDPHRALGSTIAVVASPLFVIVLMARPSRAIVIQAIVLVGLVGSAQPALANAGDNNKWVGGFHAPDGMLVLPLSLRMALHT